MEKTLDSLHVRHAKFTTSQNNITGKIQVAKTSNLLRTVLDLSTMTIHSLYHNEIIAYKLMITNAMFLAVAIEYKMLQKKLNFSVACSSICMIQDKTKYITYTQTLTGTDHSFPQKREFWAEPQKLPISVEFLCFCEIWYWPVIRGQIWLILVGFRRPYCMQTWFRREIHD